MAKKDKNHTLSYIGLEKEGSAQIAEKLNILLANYQLFYINTRGFHWNIAGEKFFELHLKFEEIYNDALLKVDEIAERILTLGYTPLHSYSDYIQVSSIQESTNISDGKVAMKHILDSYKSLLSLERIIMLMAAEMDDEGTNALMSDYIREQEKAAWMYAAYLK
jgi:starvation-inducible DNA-binding protein